MQDKKTLRIYFTDFWRHFDIHDNFFYTLLSTRFYVIIDPINPQLLIYSYTGYEFLKYKSAVRLFFTGENKRPNFTEADFALSFDYPDYDKRNLRLPLYVLYKEEELLLKPKIVEEIVVEKTRFCNMVISNPRAKYRIEFFKILNNIKKVDSGGSVLNNIGHKVKDKLEFIRQYRFTMAFENSSYPGYTTEKIFEPMKVNSIPVYWGNKDIGKEFNTKSFINVQDFSTLQEAAEFVVSIDDDKDKYKHMLKEPWFVNNQLNEYFDHTRILDFIETTVLKAYPFSAARLKERNKNAAKGLLFKLSYLLLKGHPYYATD